MKEGPDGKGADDKVVTFDPKRKLKELKPLKQRQPQQPMTLKEALVQSLQEDRENQAEYFDECYARLLRVKARLASSFLEPDDEKREALTDKLHDSMLASARMDLERLEPRKAADKTPTEKGA